MTLAKYSIKYDKSPSKPSYKPSYKSSLYKSSPYIISSIKLFYFTLFILGTLFMIYYFYIKKNDDDNIDGFETCTSCS